MLTRTYFLLAMSVALLLISSGSLVRAELFNPGQRAIVPVADVSKLFNSSCVIDDQFSTTVSSEWTATDSDVNALESKLPFAFIQAIRSARPVNSEVLNVLTDWQSISNHIRQYGGVVVGGKRYILVIAAPAGAWDFDGYHPFDYAANDNWRSGGPIGVPDIGPSMFSTLYNVEANTFGTFHFCNTL